MIVETTRCAVQAVVKAVAEMITKLGVNMMTIVKTICAVAGTALLGRSGRQVSLTAGEGMLRSSGRC